MSVGGINNINYNSSTSSADQNIQVFGTVYKTQYGIITASSLSVRNGAGTNYSILGNMINGTKIIMTGKINNFYKITYKGKIGYISMQYVKITAKPVAVVVTPVTVYKTQYGVTTSSVNIRKGPTTAYAVQGVFDSGINIDILGTAGSFYKVSYSGKTGYVSNQYVKIIDKQVVLPAAYGGVTTPDFLSVRSGAGTNYPILGNIKRSTLVIITGKINNFYKITYNGQTGYVSADYVILIGTKE